MLVGSESNIESLRSTAPDADAVVLGGTSRTESVVYGIEAVPESFKVVLIHDAARPFVSNSVIDRVIEASHDSPAVAPAVPVTDTIRDTGDAVPKVLDRSRLVAIQTPQSVWRKDFLATYRADSREATDDVAILERAGVTTMIVVGDPANIKVTTPADLPAPAMTTRTGLGYDIHSFSTDPDRPCWLGGVEFDDRPGLDGHSDADVILHALVDSLLGAAVLGDIGQRYPNSDPKWKNCSSSRFLAETGELLANEGWQIEHVDISVLAERPKIMPKAEEIRRTIASLLKIDVEQVSIKATTNERLGAIGRGEGVAAFSVATITRPNSGQG